MVRSALPLGSAKNVYWFLVKGSGLTGCCVKIFQFVVAPTSYLFRRTFLPLPWARKISLVGAQIFIFIDNAKVQIISMRAKAFSNLFQKYLKC